MPSGVCNRVAALQFDVTSAIAQGKQEILLDGKYGRSLCSIVKLHFLNFVLLF